MKEEDIKQIILNVSNKNEISFSEAFSIVDEYCFLIKNKRMTLQQFEACANMFSLESMIKLAIEFFKKKYSAISVFAKDNSFMHLYF